MLVSPREDVLFNIMNQSKFNFYLTGSRATKHASSYQDWDFFVLLEDGVLDLLESLGFETLDKVNYDLFNPEQMEKQGVSSILRHKELNIDIQLIKDESFLKKRIIINEFMSKQPEMRKTLRAEYWRILFEFLNKSGLLILDFGAGITHR